MNRPRPSRPRIVGCLAATAVFIAGCTSSTADAPTGSSGSGSSVAVSPSVADVSSEPISPSASSATTTGSAEPAGLPSTQESFDAAAQEVSDRAAVEQAWAHFWEVNDQLVRVPDSEREELASTVAVDPSLSQMLNDARSLESDGLDYYGTSVYHPYWEQSIAGQPTAVMGDCTDTSQAGSLETSTGKHRTAGVPDNNTRAVFVKGTDSKWRVSEIFYLMDIKC